MKADSLGGWRYGRISVIHRRFFPTLNGKLALLENLGLLVILDKALYLANHPT